MRKQLALFIATGFFSGRSPIAPGTVGSMFCLALWLFCLAEPGLLGSLLSQLLLILIVFAVGILSIRISLRELSQKATPPAENKKDLKDPSFIVVDEWAGQLIAVLGLVGEEPLWIITAFLLFRVFDILKPFPVGHAESLPGEWGVMMDDIVAGFYAFGLVHAARLIAL